MRRLLVLAVAIAALVAVRPAYGAPPGWSAAAPLDAPRAMAQAVTLASGKVLVIAGATDIGFDPSTRIFDPASGTWTPGPGMGLGRFLHTATLLRSGKVLVTGGWSTSPSVASVELYDPALGTWTPAPSMSTARSRHNAVLLADGNVFVFNGTYEIYDAAANTWSPSKSSGVGGIGTTTTLLRDGRVLIAGGGVGTSSIAAAWLYDPSADTFAPTGSMLSPRYNHTATLLRDGRVLVTGGTSTQGGIRSSVEIYDPKTGTWAALGGLAQARTEHSATLLTDGRVLIAGGMGTANAPLAATEVYDAATGVATSAGSLAVPRMYAATAALRDGTVLMIGGTAQSTNFATVERWTPTTTLTAPASLAFPAQLPGTAGDALAVPIANSGASPLFVDSVAVEGDFAVRADHCTGAAVTPGATCAIELRFGPLLPGERRGTLRLKANTAQRDHAIELHGTALAPEATPAPLPQPDPVPSQPQPSAPPPAPKPSRFVEIAFKSGYSTTGISRTRACRGRVTLELRNGKRVLVKRAVRLDRRCRYATTFRVERTRIGSAKRLTVIARFHGNGYLGATSNRFTVKVP